MQIRPSQRPLPLIHTSLRFPRAVGWIAGCVVLAVLLAWSPPAAAVPGFARKYGTSCLTCHTIYPKLTPFGEAFRRNGFRFPGSDSDFVKQDPVPLGQEAYKQMFPAVAWPGTVPSSVPIALGFNGQAVVHPDKTSGAAVRFKSSGAPRAVTARAGIEAQPATSRAPEGTGSHRCRAGQCRQGSRPAARG